MLTGITMCADYNAGQALVNDRNFEQHKEAYHNIIEIARRHKIMNPEKMRSSYGKLLFLLQVSSSRRSKPSSSSSSMRGSTSGCLSCLSRLSRLSDC